MSHECCVLHQQSIFQDFSSPQRLTFMRTNLGGVSTLDSKYAYEMLMAELKKSIGLTAQDSTTPTVHVARGSSPAWRHANLCQDSDRKDHHFGC